MSDLDGDGASDLAASANQWNIDDDHDNDGAAFVYYGPLVSGTYGQVSSDAMLYGGSTYAVAAVPDLDGDGADELGVSWRDTPFLSESDMGIVFGSTE
jgi:hypothetical protein